MHNEDRAHDLAILYMQAEIKAGKIKAASADDLSGFAGEYLYLCAEFTRYLND